MQIDHLQKILDAWLLQTEQKLKNDTMMLAIGQPHSIASMPT